MVYRWNCDRCAFSVWAGAKATTRESVQTHVFEHHRGKLYRDGFRVGWNCPHCAGSALKHDVEESIRAFKRHLFDHVDHRLRSGVHVADELSGSGNVLVLSPPATPGAENARIHFFAPCDVVILVTTDVPDRLRALDRRLSEWPRRTIVLTTSDQPLAGLDDVDIGDVALEIVKLEKGLGLAGLGETISRVVAEHNSPDVTLSVAFEILSEIVSKGELERVFRFLHLLTSRFDGADALAHFYCDHESQPGPTVNLLSELFDLQIDATDDRFVRR